MKKILYLLVLLTNMAFAQQWVDQQYSYDSTMNVQYGSAVNFNGTSKDLFMDIYVPQCQNPNEISEWPLLIFIHGGAFIVGSKDDASIQALCKNFAKRGYVTASISYRLGYVSDDVAWNCNYPGYECLFATDSAEWFRAYYRSVQDAKGALRYLVNRSGLYSIDTNNVFVAGESAGSFVALGVGLMDDPSERPPFTDAIADAPAPHSNAWGCAHNVGETFSGPIPRPDLGSIDGTIEPTTVDFTIKGIGNIFGATLGDILQVSNPNKPKPAIYSFHQPCDLIVPIDSKQALWGLDWCMTNGYNCYAIANTPIVHGSKTLRDWNTNNGYGYDISSNFTNTNFPYSFLIGQASCADQGNNPCHAYDSKAMRELEMANYFSSYVSSNLICQLAGINEHEINLEVFPNPASDKLFIRTNSNEIKNIQIVGINGQTIMTFENNNDEYMDVSKLLPGHYLGTISFSNGTRARFNFAKVK